MDVSKKFLSFSIESIRFGLILDRVERVFSAFEITPLPQAPDIVRGIINVHGKIIPVFDMRKRLSLPERELEATDKFVIASASRRTAAVIADDVEGVIECNPEDLVDSREVLPGQTQVQGVVKVKGGLCLIQNLDRFLDLNESQALDAALKEAVEP